MILDKAMQRVLAIMSARHGVGPNGLVGTAYQRRDRRAMWEAVWLYHEITGAGYQAAAHALGRNHSTAIYALRQISASRAASAEYAANLDALADQIAEEVGAPGRAERALRQHLEHVDRGVSHKATRAVGRLLLIAKRDPAAAAAILARFEQDIAHAHERPLDDDGRAVGAAPPASALAPAQPSPQLA